MEMHDPSFRDPIIKQPEPITIILPFMMEIPHSGGIDLTSLARGFLDSLHSTEEAVRPKV